MHMPKLVYDHHGWARKQSGLDCVGLKMGLLGHAW
jgi:hypothetical protein